MKTQVLVFKKSTKGTHVYEEQDGKGEITSQVYVKRSLFPGEPPPKIEITVKVAK